MQNAIRTEETRIDTIPGTGGLRKARWKTKTGGKSGGVRVIFYHVMQRDVYLMLLIFKKPKREKLTTDQRKHLKALVEQELKSLS